MNRRERMRFNIGFITAALVVQLSTVARLTAAEIPAKPDAIKTA